MFDIWITQQKNQVCNIRCFCWVLEIHFNHSKQRLDVCAVSNLSKQQSIFQLPQVKFISVVSFLIFSFEFSSISTYGNASVANFILPEGC